MGSPITFSGFNNIDFNVVLDAVMTQARVPVQTLQSKLSGVNSRISKFGTLSGNVFSLQQAAAALGDSSTISTLSATSSDSKAVGATATSAASAGSYDVVVNQLARAQVTVSSSVAPDPDTTVVASGGTLTIGGVDVVIAGNVTLQELATAINGTTGIGVAATVVNTGTGSYQLALAAADTGLANAFTISNGLTGGAGVAFTDTDGDGTSGDSAADNAVAAADASILLNNIAITSGSNTLDDVVTGLSLSLFKADPATTVRVGVATDSGAFKGKVQAFIDAYNTLAGFQEAERTSAATADPRSIGGDPLVRQLRSALRSLLTGAHGSGALTRLAEAGIEFTQTGELTLNAAVFDQVFAAQPNDVRDLFAGPNGVFAAVESELTQFTQADGLIPLAKDRLEDQIDTLSEQITRIEARLALQRESLLRQFIEADLAMSRLNNQRGALSSFGSSLTSS